VCRGNGKYPVCTQLCDCYVLLMAATLHNLISKSERLTLSNLMGTGSPFLLVCTLYRQASIMQAARGWILFRHTFLHYLVLIELHPNTLCLG
jgi:hypothetical protein